MPLFRPKVGTVNWSALQALNPDELVVTESDADADRLEALYPMLIEVCDCFFFFFLKLSNSIHLKMFYFSTTG